jgi:hypothetical protein
VDVRTGATSVAFVAALLAGAALGWVQGAPPPADASSRGVPTLDSEAPDLVPGSAVQPTALEVVGIAGDATSESTYLAYDGKVFAIGDSVLAGAAPCLEARGITVDAEQSRQVAAALDILQKKSDSLPARVIVHIGTNGGATAADLDAIMEVLGPQRLVLWSTIQLPDDPSRYTYERSTNDAIAALAARYANALVFDWEAATRQHPEWLYVEGIHMTPEGCEGYAGLVAPQVRTPSPHGNG